MTSRDLPAIPARPMTPGEAASAFQACALLAVECFTDGTVDRSRPYSVRRRIGSVTRVERFATEGEQARGAVQARADAALLSEAMQRGDHRAHRLDSAS